MTTKILITEDEAIIAEDLRAALEGLGYRVSGVAASAAEALHLCQMLPPDLVLMDIKIRGPMDGVEAANLIRQQFDVAVVFLTAHADAATLQRAGITEPHGYLLKPFQEDALRAAIEIALCKHKGEMRDRQMEHWLAETLQSVGDAVISLTNEGIVSGMNPIGEQLSGMSRIEATGRPFSQVMHLQPPPEWSVVPGEQMQVSRSAAMRLGDGRSIPIEYSVAPIRDAKAKTSSGFVLLIRDRSAAKQSNEMRMIVEARMHEAQRIESLSRLAGGVAHELSESVSRLLLNAGQVLMLESTPDIVRVPMGEVESEGRRMSDLCRQLLRFSGGALDERSAVQLNHLIAEMIPGLQMSLPPEVALLFSAGALPVLQADPGAIREVIDLLVTNAREAINGAGTIRIATCTKTLTAAQATPLEAGDYIRIEVSDTGVGMTGEVRARAFEPFFTTKPERRGLGLSVIQGLIRAHRGLARLESRLGSGTLVRIDLPVDQVVSKDKDVGDYPQINGPILIVEDEAAMRAALGRILQGIGYQTLLAASGEEALLIVETRRSKIGAILMDVAMPGRNGILTLRELRTRGVKVPVMFMCGCPLDVAQRKQADEMGASVLRKPFTISELREKLGILAAEAASLASGEVTKNPTGRFS